MVHIYPKRTGVIGIMGQTDTKLRENGVIIQSVNVMRAWPEIGGKWRQNRSIDHALNYGQTSFM